MDSAFASNMRWAFRGGWVLGFAFGMAAMALIVLSTGGTEHCECETVKPAQLEAF